MHPIEIGNFEHDILLDRENDIDLVIMGDHYGFLRRSARMAPGGRQIGDLSPLNDDAFAAAHDLQPGEARAETYDQADMIGVGWFGTPDGDEISRSDLRVGVGGRVVQEDPPMRPQVPLSQAERGRRMSLRRKGPFGSRLVSYRDYQRGG